MHDQADPLRRLIRDAAGREASGMARAHTVVLSGTHSGVGVTTLAANLATELTLLGKRVAIMDGNVTRPRLAAQLGVRPRVTLSQLLNGSRSAAEAFVKTSDGTLLLAGSPADDASAISGDACERLAAELTVVSRQASIILIDAGAGMNPWVDRLWRLASQLLIVAEADPSAVLEAYAMVKQAQFHRLDRRIRLAFNRGDHAGSDLDSLETRFAETCRRFLCIEPRPAMNIPRRTTADLQEDRSDHQSYGRALRLLAADLACEARAAFDSPTRFPGNARKDARTVRASIEPDSPAARGKVHGLVVAR